jgi:hypothetical protein
VCFNVLTFLLEIFENYNLQLLSDLSALLLVVLSSALGKITISFPPLQDEIFTEGWEEAVLQII